MKFIKKSFLFLILITIINPIYSKGSRIKFGRNYETNLLEEYQAKQKMRKNVAKLRKESREKKALIDQLITTITTNENSEENTILKNYLNNFEKLPKKIKKQVEEAIEKIYENRKKEEQIENYNETWKKLNEDISYLEDQQQKLKKIINGKGVGDNIAEAISGVKLRNTIIGNNALEGIKTGFIVRATKSLGNAVGTKAEHWSTKLLDVSENAVVEKARSFYRWIFHGSRKPFTETEIQSWKTLILSDLQEIETMVKSTEKYSSRSREEILRELENDVVNNKEAINLWEDLIADTVYTCEQLAEEIENRKGYYKKNNVGFGISNCSERLQNKLLNIRNWLVSVQSVKDFAAISEVKLIIPAMKKSFKNYCEFLEKLVKPENSSPSKSGYSSGNPRKNKHDYDSLSNDSPDYFM